MAKDFTLTTELVYNTCNLPCTSLRPADGNTIYSPFSLKINNYSVQFRVAKITPKKVGQFVAIWKRGKNGETEPYHVSDTIDFLVISCRDNELFGQFVFPKSVLIQKRILSNNGIDGKRGIRVYPPWSKPINKQAQKTQLWQLNYFLEIPSDKPVDCLLAKKLYSKK